ncbi:MAG: hypothetical protein GTO02_02470 [Candidatus Dadabacteria bacterium]|nr:hypothetical protein [Candidatus Dadabacteria bacterium]NIQ13297.1 hypothetical protein [Candidatus Dadabacteria bacterium]
MNYEILDHTADIKIRVFGNDFREILENSASAILEIINNEDVNPDVSHNFEVSGEGKDQILVRLINELIYILQTEKLLIKNVQVEKEGEHKYMVFCKGIKINNEHELNYDIKGATYHDLLIEKEGDRLKAEFVIDV